MARGSRGSSSRGRASSPSPARNAPTATKPMPAQTPVTQPQTQQKGGLLSGIGSTIMQGFAFGAGSAVAHEAVRSVMGGSSHSEAQQQQAPQEQSAQQSQQSQQSPCQYEMTSFSNCLSQNDNIQYCQNFADMLKNCKQTNNIL